MRAILITLATAGLIAAQKMIRMLVLALTAVLLAPAIIAQPAQPLERHEWVIRDFHTESGVVLPEARLVYTTLGKLNAANDNAILLPSHYMANFNGYNWLIGAAPDRALDPARDLLILTELFGNGRSSSPSNTPAGTTFDQVWQGFRKRFSADANNYILQARTWQRHDVGTTPGFNGDTEKALRSIKARVLYMPSETDLYFPMSDARHEQAFIPRVTFMPIPSLWGHTAGAASNPADLKFLNENVAKFLK